jgi:hypothetical protein
MDPLDPLGGLDPGKVGVDTTSNSSIDTTLAENLSLSSSVSPGTAIKVPVDCSPAMTFAAYSKS